MTAFLCSLVNISEMLRYSCVSIETVDNIEVLSHFRCLLRKISSTAAADNHYVNIICHILCVIQLVNLNTVSERLHG